MMGRESLAQTKPQWPTWRFRIRVPKGGVTPGAPTNVECEASTTWGEILTSWATLDELHMTYDRKVLMRAKLHPGRWYVLEELR